MQKIAQFEKVDFDIFAKANSNLTSEEAKGIYNDIKLPKRATKGSAGYDFFTPFEFNLQAGQTITIPSGIRVKINQGWVLQIYPRSGLGFRFRLQLNNTVGIIDSDYYNSDNQGHIFIRMTNCDNDGKTITLNKGDAFAQGMFVEYGITFDDDVSAMRNGGFGSTDIK